MFSHKTTNEVPLGEGLFRKQGSNVKSWKVRKYSLLPSYTLQYSDALSNVVKGRMNISNVTVREGARENGKNSGGPKEAIAMDICSFDDSRNLEVVFDSVDEAKQFLLVLLKCTRKHNIPGFCKSQGWTDVLGRMAASVASSEKSPATSAPAKESATDITNTAMEKAAAGTGSTGFGTGAGAGKVELFGVVDSGNFRKQGSYIASWKVRQYIIKGDGSLVYLDPTSGDLKGSMSVKIIELYKGSDRNIEISGCTILTEGESGYPLDLHIIEGNRKLELVFDSVADAKKFVYSLSLVASSHNIASFVEMNNWTNWIPQNNAVEKQYSNVSDSLLQDRRHSITAPLRGNMMTHPLVIYHRTLRLDATPELLHNGIFRKFTNLTATTVTRVWNERRYEVYSNGILKYYPYSTGEQTPALTEKAAFSVDYVLCRVGPEGHIEASGSEDYSIEQGIAIDLYMYADKDEFNMAIAAPPMASKLLTHADKLSHLVFDTVADAKLFLGALGKAALRHNIRDYADRVGWPVMKDPDEHVEFDASVAGTSVDGVAAVDMEFDYEGVINVDSTGKPVVPMGSVVPVGDESTAAVTTDGAGGEEESAGSSLRVSNGEDMPRPTNFTEFHSEFGDDGDSRASTTGNRRPSTTLMQKAADAGNVLKQKANDVASTTVRVASAISEVVVDKNLTRSSSVEGAIRVVGEGVFRKQGSNVRSWKVRKYVITSDHILWYYDSAGTLKGNMCIKNIRVGDGTPESISSSGIPGPQQVRAMAVNVKSLTDNRVMEIVVDSEGDCRNFMLHLNGAAINSNISSYVAKTGWDPKPFEVTGATQYLKASHAGGKTGAAATTAATAGESSNNEATVLPSVPSLGGSISAAAPAPAPAKVRTEPTLTTQNVIIALNNILAIIQLLAKLAAAKNKACTCNIVAWFALLLYVWIRPNLFRIICLLLYSYGLYTVVLASTTMAQTDALKISLSAVAGEIPTAGTSASPDSSQQERGRNWNVNKKTQ